MSSKPKLSAKGVRTWALEGPFGELRIQQKKDAPHYILLRWDYLAPDRKPAQLLQPMPPEVALHLAESILLCPAVQALRARGSTTRQ